MIRNICIASAAIMLGIAPHSPRACGDDKGSPRKQVTGKNDTHIADLAWIAGHWGRRDGRDRLEEYWSTPEADCIMGMFRWIKGGKVWIYEMLTIRQEDDGIVFRFRHFGKQLGAWEPKDAPLTFTLTSHDGRRAVFQSANPSQRMRRFVFEREGDDKLIIRVGSGKNPDVFEYTREP